MRAHAGDSGVPEDDEEVRGATSGEPGLPATESVPPSTPFFPSFLSRATSASVLGAPETDPVEEPTARVGAGEGTVVAAGVATAVGEAASWARRTIAYIGTAPQILTKAANPLARSASTLTRIDRDACARR